MGKGNRLRTLSDMELADETSRSVTLIDLAGHTKYLKTTLHGLIGRRPDHCIVCVSATTGLNNITTEHLGVCMYLNVPLVIVITKEDCVGYATSGKPKTKTKAARTRNTYSPDSTTSTLVVESQNDTSCSIANKSEAISRLVASVQGVLSGSQRQSQLITTDAELVQHILSESDAYSAGADTIPKALVPIFTVSNVTGSGLQLLRSYLFQLPTHAKQRTSIQGQATCVRILGSIGNIDDRDEFVFPRDEDRFAFKKPVRVRHSINRHAIAVNQIDGEETGELKVDKNMCLMTSSSSDDNILAKEKECKQQAACASALPPGDSVSASATIRRPHSSPDLPSSGEKASTQATELKYEPTPRGEFYEYVEAVTTSVEVGGSPAGQNLVSSRTKVLIGSIEAGKISVGESLLLGPTCAGEFVQVYFSYNNPQSRSTFFFFVLMFLLMLQVVVSSLRLNNVPVCSATAGQTVTLKLSEALVSRTPPAQDSAEGEPFNIRSAKLAEGRRRTSAAGLVLLSPASVSATTPIVQCASPKSGVARAPEQSSLPAMSHWEFEAELLVLNHPSKIRVNYEPVVHVGCVKQSAKLVSVRKLSTTDRAPGHLPMDGSEDKFSAVLCQDELGNGERGICRFRFLYYPEFIIPGEAMIIREQRTRGVGTISKLS